MENDEIEEADDLDPIREEALRAAIDARNATGDPDMIVEAAKKFEAYLRGGA